MQTCLREVFVLAVLLCLQGTAIKLLQYQGEHRFGDWEDAAAIAVGLWVSMQRGKNLSKMRRYE